MIDWKALRAIFQIDPQRAVKRWDSLTPREREVAEKMARGWTNPQIAERLKISPKTLDIHRANAKAKLDAKTAAGIAAVYFVVKIAEVHPPAA